MIQSLERVKTGLVWFRDEWFELRLSSVIPRAPCLLPPSLPLASMLKTRSTLL